MLGVKGYATICPFKKDLSYPLKYTTKLDLTYLIKWSGVTSKHNCGPLLTFSLLQQSTYSQFLRNKCIGIFQWTTTSTKERGSSMCWGRATSYLLWKIKTMNQINPLTWLHSTYNNCKKINIMQFCFNHKASPVKYSRNKQLASY